MNTINDGGPAFPVTHNGDVYSGMSLLDYFAGLALQGFLATNPPNAKIEVFAAVCYEVATAMLAERERRIKEATQ